MSRLRIMITCPSRRVSRRRSPDGTSGERAGQLGRGGEAAVAVDFRFVLGRGFWGGLEGMEQDLVEYYKKFICSSECARQNPG